MQVYEKGIVNVSNDAANLSPYFVCIHRDSIILSIDEGGAQLLGFRDPVELTGKSIFPFLYEEEKIKASSKIATFEMANSHPGGIMKFLINGVQLDLEVKSERTLFRDEPAIRSILRFITPIVHDDNDGPQYKAPLFLNANKGIIITKPDGIILSVSESFTRLTGFYPHEVIGNNPRMWKSRSYTSTFYEKMWGSLLTKGCWQGELWNKRRDGSHYLMKVNIYSVLNGEGQLTNYMAIYTDFTEVEKLAQQLRESEEQYRFIAENSSDLIGRLSRDGEIIYISPSCRRILGYKNEELLGTNIFQKFHPDDMESLILEYGDLKNIRGIVTLSYRMLHKNGDYIWAETVIRSVKDKLGNLTGMMFSTRDITSRRTIELQLRESNLLLRKISSLDGLTEIYNRRAFDEFLQSESVFATQHNTPLSLIMFDIDYFKKYNDTYGHIQGDECLKIVARKLEDFFQEKGCYAARYGGEEFVVVLPNTDSLDAYKLAEEFRDLIQSMKIENRNSKVSEFVTISIGISSLCPKDDHEVKLLLHQADRCLYQAKQNGRNRTEICSH